MSTKAEFEAELAVIKARADYYERPDLISRRTFLETELNRLNGATQGNYLAVPFSHTPFLCCHSSSLSPTLSLL